MAKKSSYIVQGFGEQYDDSAYVIFNHSWTKNELKIGTRRRNRDLLDTFINMYFQIFELPEPQYNQGMNIRYTIPMSEEEYINALNDIKSSDLTITTTTTVARLM